MGTEVICTIGRYVVVKYTRCRNEPVQELRYRVLDRETNIVVGAPFGYPDAQQAEAFVSELNLCGSE